jgi:hypothetical protein
MTSLSSVSPSVGGGASPLLPNTAAKPPHTPPPLPAVIQPSLAPPPRDFVAHLNTIVEQGTTLADTVASSLLRGQTLNQSELETKRRSLIQAIDDGRSHEGLGGSVHNASAVVIQGIVPVSSPVLGQRTAAVVATDVDNLMPSGMPFYSSSSSSPAAAETTLVPANPVVPTSLDKDEPPTATNSRAVPAAAREAIAMAKAQSAQTVGEAVAQAVRVLPAAAPQTPLSPPVVQSQPTTPPASLPTPSAPTPALPEEAIAIDIDIDKDRQTYPTDDRLSKPMISGTQGMVPITRQHWRAFTANALPPGPASTAGQTTNPSPFVQNPVRPVSQASLAPPPEPPASSGVIEPIRVMGQWIGQLLMSLLALIVEEGKG